MRSTSFSGGRLRFVLAAAIALGADVGAAHADDLAVEPNGRAHFAFEMRNTDHSIIATRRQATDGTLDAGAVVAVTPAGHSAGSATVELDADGREVILWMQGPTGGPYELRGRRRSAAGALGPVQTLASGVLGGVEMALDDGGGALVVWTKRGDRYTVVQGRRWTATGEMSAVQTLSPVSYPAANPRVEVDPTGNAVVAWNRRAPDMVQTRRRAVGGALGSIRNVSPVRQGQRVDVDVADDGSAVFAWGRHVRAGNPDGTLGPLVELTTELTGSTSVAVAAEGAAAIVYSSHAPGEPEAVWIRHRTASGVLEPAQLLHRLPLYRQVHDPVEVVLDPAGNAVATWNHEGAVMTRRRLANGTLGSLAKVNPPAAGDDGYAIGIDVAVDAAGASTFMFRSPYRATPPSPWSRRRSPDGIFGAAWSLPFETP